MDSNVRIQLENIYNGKDIKYKKEVSKIYENSESLYHTVWENILNDYKNKNNDCFDDFKFKIKLSSKEYNPICIHVEYSICESDSEEKGSVYSRPMDIGYLDTDKRFCLDYFVDMLIKAGFIVKPLEGNILEFEISRRQIRFLTDVSGYTNNKDTRYYRLKIKED